jgi:hypothetical protein
MTLHVLADRTPSVGWASVDSAGGVASSALMPQPVPADDASGEALGHAVRRILLLLRPTAAQHPRLPVPRVNLI